MTQTSQETGTTISLEVQLSTPYAIWEQLVVVLESLKQGRLTISCAQDGSVSEMFFLLSEPLHARTGDRYGG